MPPLIDPNDMSETEKRVGLVIEDFLSVIQHRLRTPVQANLRITELFLQEDFGAMTAEQREVLIAMRDNSREIDRLLSMLVDIYRYRNGHVQLRFEEHELHRFLAPTISALHDKCSARKLDVEVQVPQQTYRIRADRDELEKLMSHLTDNALRFARKRVVLSASKTEELVVIAVADDGKGIASADIANLFTRFSQVSSSGKYNAVTGAGLCLCAEIAKAHGGELLCESEVNRGATFKLIIPSTW